MVFCLYIYSRLSIDRNTEDAVALKPFHPSYFDHGPAVARSIPDKDFYNYAAGDPQNPMMR